MDNLTRKYKDEGCTKCGYYEQIEDLLQEEDQKSLVNIHKCKLFKKKLVNTKSCEKFVLHPATLREAIDEAIKQS